MSTTRTAPAWFRAELLRRFGSGHDAVWDGIYQRWAIISPSAVGYPTRQLVLQRVDREGNPTKPDIAGILPFRDLDPETCHEILRKMEASSLTNRHDGAQTWAKKGELVLAHNAALSDAYAESAARNYVYGLTQMDLKRPWLKHHSGTATERKIAWRT